MKALALAMEKEMPVMGICRGMQLINVHLGGTLCGFARRYRK